MANFKFNAHGNFSGCFGWDSGIDSISVGCQVPSYDHYLWQEVGYSASHNVAEYFQNKYGSGLSTLTNMAEVGMFGVMLSHLIV